ncbi:conserved exported hypothetical protein [Candidatus Desulfosporosinus infrequens]|uniref:HEAT repeat domain-containing protein n=1 Tax=Candidatus Desulfosporosinus infrequens TaxID=2043169 RepID=A0A2U3K927_9FIRM|nr:conserved exported hypothetical protein [Candidatus Desulfosporosinus infrequens]
MSKKLAIIGSLVISGVLVSSFVFQNSYAFALDAKTGVSLPNQQDIVGRAHLNRLETILTQSKTPQKDVDNYLKGLNKDELLLAIAEVSDEIKDPENISDLQIFASATEEKLLGNLTNANFESIFTNPNYSNPFKEYAMDIKSTENYHNGSKNNTEYNQLLRNIFQDKTQPDNLRLVSLLQTDDYNAADVPTIEALISSQDSPALLKANAVRILKSIDKEKGMKHVLDILKNANLHSEPEVIVSLDTLGNYTKQVENITDSEDEIDLVNDVLNQTNNPHVVKAAVFSLAQFKNAKSIATVLQNRSKINDDYAIRFYIDRNFLVVADMLNSSDSSVLNTALTSVEIAPFKSFLPKITELEASTIDQALKARLDKIINLIDSSNIDRNIKWDAEYK